MKPAILHHPIKVAERLSELGLTHEILWEAVAVGTAAYDSCTANHPVTAPGFYAWSETCRSLNEQLVTKGWQRRHERGLSLIVHPSMQHAITVTTGNEMTGSAEDNPRTKNCKGPVLMAAIYQNSQMDFGEIITRQAPIAAPTLTASENPSQWITFLLLVARFEEEVRCELSLPESLGDDLRIEGWAERIILGSQPRNLDPLTRKQPEINTQPDIIVPITRRAN